MIRYESYSTEFPYLPVEIMLFYSDWGRTTGSHYVPKTLSSFTEYYKDKYSTSTLPQPKFVSKICDNLMKYGGLSQVEKKGFDDLQSTYMANVPHRDILLQNQLLFEEANKVFSIHAYGFPYIYNCYKKYVLPIHHVNLEGKGSIGSSFLYKGGLLTAKHCISGARKIGIQGIPKENLNNATFFIHERETVDLLFISFENPISDCIQLSNNGNILDDVLTMGFPILPGFESFCTGEKAMISSRFVATRGSIASEPVKHYIMRESTILITAKIRGGNSGGPVINRKGEIVGVSIGLPDGDGDYDELGYGMVAPSDLANQVVNSRINKLGVGSIEFIDFS